MDINTIIQKAIEQQVHAVVNEAIEDLQLKFEGLRGHIANQMNALQDTQGLQQMLSAHHHRMNNIETDLKTVKVAPSAIDALQMRLIRIEETLSFLQERFALKEDLEVAMESRVSHTAHAALIDWTERLQRRVNTLDHAMGKDDEQFEEDVKTVVLSVLDDMKQVERDGHEDVKSVHDQDEEDAHIREIMRDMLEDDAFTEALKDRVAEMFTNGALTISIDKI